jgi:hypothetical protein
MWRGGHQLERGLEATHLVGDVDARAVEDDGEA